MDMVNVGRIGISIVTVFLSGGLSGLLSWKIAKGKLQMKYEWERYSNAEGWCDDFIRLIRELQANYEYKYNILNEDISRSEDWIPGEDLDEYGTRVVEHLANRPVIIFNLIGDREEGEIGMSDRAGAISRYCGILADDNLKSDDDAAAKMEEFKEDFYQDCDSLIDELMSLRNENLKADFKNDESSESEVG